MTESKDILRHKLLSLGHVVPLKLFVQDEQSFKNTISAYQDHFKPYNPKKKGHNRWGLSITSKDGSFSGIPNLDSLSEYNKLHGTQFDEIDFRIHTPFFKDCEPLKESMGPFVEFMGRSHILKLDKGGFFPPHRDLGENSFRLFISLCDKMQYVFLLDGKVIHFQENQIYFINTLLTHSLFSFRDGSLFALFNVDLIPPAVDAVFNSLYTY